MLHPVWPSVYFWYFLGLCSSLLWLIPSMEMELIKKSTPLVGVFVRLTILISWFVGNTVLSIIFLSLIENPRIDHFFRGYECVGKTVRYALLSFGNIGLYYYSEKSIACMLTFLFLGFFCLCTLFYIQPITDFGVLDFFLSGSLTQALSLFGLHIYSWLVFIAVIVLAGLRYRLELELLQQPPREVESGRMANADSEGQARDIMECDSEPAMDMIKLNVLHLRILKRSGHDSELARDIMNHVWRIMDSISKLTRKDCNSELARYIMDRISELARYIIDNDSELARDITDLVSELARLIDRVSELARDVMDRDSELARNIMDRDLELARDIIDRVLELEWYIMDCNSKLEWDTMDRDSNLARDTMHRVLKLIWGLKILTKDIMDHDSELICLKILIKSCRNSELAKARDIMDRDSELFPSHYRRRRRRLRLPITEDLEHA